MSLHGSKDKKFGDKAGVVCMFSFILSKVSWQFKRFSTPNVFRSFVLFCLRLFNCSTEL
jgi:hypothetical protein